ncbi:MAG: PHP domain-containing protein [Gemmatimonadales bacterium]
MRRPLIIATGLTAGMLLARAFGAPALADPTGAALSPSLHLHFPLLNILLAPLFDIWDGVSMLGMRQLVAFSIWTAVAIVVWRVGAWAHRRTSAQADGRPGARAVSSERLSVRSLLTELAIVLGGVLALLLFGLVGLVWHRPMVSLVGAPAGQLVVDLHTHTNVSHDVQGTLMRGFDAEAARRWHRRAGFDVFFITDHNRIDGIPADGGPAGAVPALCPGEEVSAADQHVVLLGNTSLVNNHDYGDSLPGILRLFRDAGPHFGAIAIASIPEYDKNHFHDLHKFADAGVLGFEIVNGAPKANELTLAHRDSVIALARARNLVLLGVSDSHGWGATAEGWTLVRVDGRQARDAQRHGRSDAPEAIRAVIPSVRASERLSTFPPVCTAILNALERGYGATQIAARHRLRPDGWWPRWLTPVGVVWEGWRAMGVAQALGWLLWIWGIAAVAARRAVTSSDDRP